MDTLILTADDLRAVVRHVGLDAFMDETIARLGAACVDMDDTTFSVPVRDGFEDGRGGLVEWMPVMDGRRDSTQTATMKLVGYHPENPQQGLPTILSVALTMQVDTGHLLALSDATFATAVRTGAASALASTVLAPPDAAVLGLVGAGAQAITQAHALSRCFPIDTILTVEADPAVSASFRERLGRLPGLARVEIVPTSIEDLQRRADIICTATSVDVGAGPVLPDGTFKPHVHINAVGSDFPGKVELARSILERSFVVADFKAQALREGECQQMPPSHIQADLPELMKGAAQFSAKQDSSTIFDSTGYAVEDHVVIGFLHEVADELGLGQRLDIEANAPDPRNPYHFIGE